MRRRCDWEARLNAYLGQLRGVAHCYGRHDCCTFSAGAVEAMTGDDPMPEFRGRYSTARGSVRALRKLGGGTLAKTLDAKFEAIPTGLAQRGDIVMDDKAIGICMGAIAIMVGQEAGRDGLVRVQRAEWTRAWRVPA